MTEASAVNDSEKYYEAFLDMFVTQGWKQLKDEFANNIATLANVEAVKGNDDLFFKKGQLNILANMINFETTVELAMQQMNEEAENSDADN